MLSRWIRKYFSIIFVLATLLGVFHHHHDDVQVHNDCQICIIQSNIIDGDIPTTTLYLSKIDIESEAVIAELKSLYIWQKKEKLQARAPPKIS